MEKIRNVRHVNNLVRACVERNDVEIDIAKSFSSVSLLCLIFFPLFDCSITLLKYYFIQLTYLLESFDLVNIEEKEIENDITR